MTVHFVPMLIDITFKSNLENAPELEDTTQRIVAIRFTDDADTPQNNTMFYIGEDGTGYPADWVEEAYEPIDD